MNRPKFKEEDVAMLYEIRGNYDGWSVANLKDDTFVNRWEPDSPYYKAAQELIEEMKGKHNES